MKTSELQRRIELLRAELDRTTGIDEDARRKLQSLVTEIERSTAESMRSSTTAESPPTSLREQMLATMTDFEVKHPQLAASLSQLVDQLAMMGI